MLRADFSSLVKHLISLQIDFFVLEEIFLFWIFLLQMKNTVYLIYDRLSALNRNMGVSSDPFSYFSANIEMCFFDEIATACRRVSESLSCRPKFSTTNSSGSHLLSSLRLHETILLWQYPRVLLIILCRRTCWINDYRQFSRQQDSNSYSLHLSFL